MIQEINGQITAGKGKYAIVVSRFNEFITSKLLGGAIDCLQRHGAADDQIAVVWSQAPVRSPSRPRNWPPRGRTTPLFVSAR